MKYIIVPTSSLSSIDFSKVKQSKSTVRYSLDGSEFIVKYDGTRPSFLSNYTELSRSEILPIVNGDGWTPEENL